MNLTIKQPTSSTDAPASGCGSYSWHGTTYTTSGTKTWTGTNAAGCDSVVSIVVTINPIANTAITRSACISYTWSANSQTYSTGGTYTNANGCSTDTLHLTINQPTSSSPSQSACTSYAWHGTTYTTSGTKTWTGTNAAGCDSVVTLNLTINQATSSTDAPASECGSYSWHGTTYTTSGIKTWTGTNAIGCDSVVTINITIKQPSSSTTLISNCGSYTWPIDGQTYSTSGTYSKPLGANSIGCDSVAYLVLSCPNSNNPIIYPNPTTNGKVTINWGNANIKIGTKVQLVVYDRIGKVVSKIPLTTSSTVEENIDLKINGYSNGLYVVSIEVMYTKYKYSTKIIKQTK